MQLKLRTCAQSLSSKLLVSEIKFFRAWHLKKLMAAKLTAECGSPSQSSISSKSTEEVFHPLRVHGLIFAVKKQSHLLMKQKRTSAKKLQMSFSCQSVIETWKSVLNILPQSLEMTFKKSYWRRLI